MGDGGQQGAGLCEGEGEGGKRSDTRADRFSIPEGIAERGDQARKGLPRDGLGLGPLKESPHQRRERVAPGGKQACTGGGLSKVQHCRYSFKKLCSYGLMEKRRRSRARGAKRTYIGERKRHEKDSNLTRFNGA